VKNNCQSVTFFHNQVHCFEDIFVHEKELDHREYLPDQAFPCIKTSRYNRRKSSHYTIRTRPDKKRVKSSKVSSRSRNPNKSTHSPDRLLRDPEEELKDNGDDFP